MFSIYLLDDVAQWTSNRGTATQNTQTSKHLLLTKTMVSSRVNDGLFVNIIMDKSVKIVIPAVAGAGSLLVLFTYCTWDPHPAGEQDFKFPAALR